jgi:biopolymer transport protein ExbD
MIFKDRQREDPRLEMTSLVDILFLLIIFFTVTTTFAPSAGIDVDLPQASAQRPIQKAEKLYIVVDRKSKIYLEGKEVNDAGLRKKFQSLAVSEEDVLVIIQADKGTPHGSVVSVMDMAQAAGLSRLAIAIEKKREAGPAEENPEFRPLNKEDKPEDREKLDDNPIE